MNIWPKAFLLALTVAALCACSPSNTGQAGASSASLEVGDARMNLPPPGRSMGAIYMRLHNHSERDRQLLGVSTEIAGSAAVHRSVYENGVVSMREVPHPVVPAGGSLIFEPGSYHVMLMDMEPLSTEQGHFELVLTFDGGETLTTQVELVAP